MNPPPASRRAPPSVCSMPLSRSASTVLPWRSWSKMPTKRWPSPIGPTFWSTAKTAAPAPPARSPPTRKSEGSFSGPDIGLVFWGLVFWRPSILGHLARGFAMTATTRRALIKGAAAAIAAAPIPVRAQADPVKFGILTPLTGAGGQDGPRMLKAIEAVINEVNKSGGVLGRKIETIVEDDQTNPEAAVRAARKLVEVNKVPVIMGTWASAVTSAVAPVCWESKTFLCTVSGADSITQLPHQGYIIRTQPNSKLQAYAHGEFIAGMGKKKLAVIGIQAPFELATKEHLDAVLKTKGGSVVAHIIYEKDKPTYRSEVDQALRSDPDFLYLNGYAPDTVVVLRDLYKANINLPKFCQSYAVPQKTLDAIPA